MAERLLIKTAPEACNFRRMGIALTLEIFSILVRRFDFAIHIIGELLLEYRMRELLQQDRRKIHIGFQREFLLLQLGKNPQQGQIGLGCGLMQPLHSMRPGSVIHHIRKVGMKSETDISELVLCLLFWFHGRYTGGCTASLFGCEIAD